MKLAVADRPGDGFADRDRNGLREDRAVVDERVEAAVLAAGIDALGKRIEERPIVRSADGRLLEAIAVDGDNGRPKAGVEKRPCETVGVAAPQREGRFEAGSVDAILAIGADILEIQIGERDPIDPAIAVVGQHLVHDGLVGLVRRLRR